MPQNNSFLTQLYQDLERRDNEFHFNNSKELFKDITYGLSKDNSVPEEWLLETIGLWSGPTQAFKDRLHQNANNGWAPPFSTENELAVGIEKLFDDALKLKDKQYFVDIAELLDVPNPLNHNTFFWSFAEGIYKLLKKKPVTVRYLAGFPPPFREALSSNNLSEVVEREMGNPRHQQFIRKMYEIIDQKNGGQTSFFKLTFLTSNLCHPLFPAGDQAIDIFKIFLQIYNNISGSSWELPEVIADLVPYFNVGLWNHSKVISINGKLSIVGGHNYSKPYLNNPPDSLDVSMRLDGDAVGQAQNFLNHLWQGVQNHFQDPNNFVFCWGVNQSDSSRFFDRKTGFDLNKIIQVPSIKQLEQAQFNPKDFGPPPKGQGISILSAGQLGIWGEAGDIFEKIARLVFGDLDQFTKLSASLGQINEFMDIFNTYLFFDTKKKMDKFDRMAIESFINMMGKLDPDYTLASSGLGAWFDRFVSLSPLNAGRLARVWMVLKAESSVQISQQRLTLPLSELGMDRHAKKLGSDFIWPMDLMYAFAKAIVDHHFDQNGKSQDSDFKIQVVTSHVGRGGYDNQLEHEEMQSVIRTMVRAYYAYRFANVRHYQRTINSFVEKKLNYKQSASALQVASIGVTYEEYGPKHAWPGSLVWGPSIRNHAKILMADERYAYIGSGNLYPSFLQEYGYILDVNDSPRLKEWLIEKYWKGCWAGSFSGS